MNIEQKIADMGRIQDLRKVCMQDNWDGIGAKAVPHDVFSHVDKLQQKIQFKGITPLKTGGLMLHCTRYTIAVYAMAYSMVLTETGRVSQGPIEDLIRAFYTI